MKKNKLYEQIISDTNVYNAIYSIDSYIYEKGLLSEENIVLYNKIVDRYNFEEITPFIKECQEELKRILGNKEELFDVQVYFKLKKIGENNTIVYRPIHSASITTQVCMVALLNVIMFDDKYSDSGKPNQRRLSSLSNLIPANFYGNLPSVKIEAIFQPWKHKYQEYSEAVIDKYNRFKDNKQYSHEVSLDFKEFFPRINPKFVYNYIVDKLHTSFDKTDISTLKMAVSKLLYCKITNLDDCGHELRKQYYDRNDVLESYSRGILQGLPQGYFFGNICMIELSKNIYNVFEGEALYYVDDSVIYTNKYENFSDKINELNTDLNNTINRYVKAKPLVSQGVLDCHSQLSYNVELHNEKSYISKLDDAHWGLSQLRLLAGETYNINSALFLSTNEIEDSTTINKLNSITEIISNECKWLTEKLKSYDINTDEYNALKGYEKLLIRYSKFCLFRKQLILLRIPTYEELPLDINSFCEKYLYLSKEDFFDIYDKNIFEAELGLLIGCTSCAEMKNIVDAISKFEMKITGNSESCDYYYYARDIQGKVNLAKLNPTRGDALSIWVELNYRMYNKRDSKVTISELQKIFEIEYNSLSLFTNSEYSSFAYSISNEFRRRLLNAIFSQIINVNVSDSTILQKKDNRPLKYYELRLLTWLRNSNCKTEEFIPFAKAVLYKAAKEDYSIENIDYQLIEILHILVAKVKDPLKVDNIIEVHKLVNGLWKNGSKFLHFYTLHDEEHSIALVKNIITIVNSISYLNIKELDYYILFLACYLHDISMVIHPDLRGFTADTSKSDIIYSDFISEVSSGGESLYTKPKSEIKHLILSYFEKVYDYFENKIRDGHTKDSASFVKKRAAKSYLKFIDNTILQLVAEIAESHGYQTKEVYGRKSYAKTELYSVKYMMILIRFADLLDLAKDRVSYYILKENISHMSTTSQFHWISHYITDRCELNTEYIANKPTESDNWLRKGAIREVVNFNLHLNTKQLTSTLDNECKCSCYVSCKHNIEDNLMKISVSNEDIGSEKICKETRCSLLCKWMIVKHEYLFCEIHSLVRYLDNVNRGLFTTEVVVNVHYDNRRSLDAEFMDSIRKYLNE